MTNFRVAEIDWQGKHIMYIITNKDILRHNQADRIFETYQKDNTVVFISCEDNDMILHLSNGELMTSFLKAVDVNRLRFGPPQTI